MRAVDALERLGRFLEQGGVLGERLERFARRPMLGIVFERLLQRGEPLRALFELVDLELREPVEKLALQPGFGGRLHASFENFGERAEVFRLLVEAIERGQDLGVVTGLLAGLDVRVDGAAVVAELALGDLAETSPEALCNGRIEDRRGALLERVGESAVATGRRG